MFQSSYGLHDHENGLIAQHDYSLIPTKSTLDGEPRYEWIPVGFYFNGPSLGGAKVKTALANDGSFTIVYSPRGDKFTIDKSFLKAEKLKEVWLDPRYGAEFLIHTSCTGGIQPCTPSNNGRGNDWILIVKKAE